MQASNHLYFEQLNRYQELLEVFAESRADYLRLMESQAPNAVLERSYTRLKTDHADLTSRWQQLREARMLAARLLDKITNERSLIF